jgi:hypothetical protein
LSKITHNPFPNIKFNNTSTKEIEKIIKSIKVKNSHGYGGITTNMLKVSAPYIERWLNQWRATGCYNIISCSVHLTGKRLYSAYGLPSCLYFSLHLPEISVNRTTSSSSMNRNGSLWSRSLCNRLPYLFAASCNLFNVPILSRYLTTSSWYLKVRTGPQPLPSVCWQWLNETNYIVKAMYLCPLTADSITTEIYKYLQFHSLCWWAIFHNSITVECNSEQITRFKCCAIPVQRLLHSTCTIWTTYCTRMCCHLSSRNFRWVETSGC